MHQHADRGLPFSSTHILYFQEALQHSLSSDCMGSQKSPEPVHRYCCGKRYKPLYSCQISLYDIGSPPPLFLIAKSFWDLCKIVDDTDGTHELSQCDFYILIQALG